jgi:hypothetical protein
MPGIAEMTRRRGGAPFEGEIFMRGGLTCGPEIVRATLCNARAQCWEDIERTDGESESAFMARVRAACFEHGGHIVWNLLPHPGWGDD